VVRYADANKSVFSVAGLTPPNELKLSVSHDTGKNGEARHQVRIDRTEVDAFGVAATLSVYTVIVRPPNTALTAAIVKEAINQLVDFWVEGGSNANVDKILNFET
jgi:hypothetical protein